jgi:hypothetical protein
MGGGNHPRQRRFRLDRVDRSALRANARYWSTTPAVAGDSRLRRLRDPFVTDLALTFARYLVLAYFVVYMRELRHMLPLAIAILPLAVSEYDR